MSACGPSHTGTSGGETARRMRAITAGLTDAGLVACLNETRGVLDITATVDRPGGKASEVIVDEDGYVEVRYWNHPGATPEHITAVIVRALAAIVAQQTSFLPVRTASAKDGLDL